MSTISATRYEMTLDEALRKGVFKVTSIVPCDTVFDVFSVGSPGWKALNGIEREIMPKRSPIDFSKMLLDLQPSCRAIIIGDTHDLSSIVDMVIDNLDLIKSKGITVLGLEMGEEMGRSVTAYQAENFGKKDIRRFSGREEMQAKVSMKIRKYDGEKTVSRTMNLFDHATLSGLRIVALDRTEYEIEDRSSIAHLINEEMARNIKCQLNKGEFMLAFIGLKHMTGDYTENMRSFEIMENNGVPAILSQKYNIKSFCVAFCGGKLKILDNDPIAYVSRRMGLRKNGFMIKMDAEKIEKNLLLQYYRNSDFVIHLPQVEAPLGELQ